MNLISTFFSIPDNYPLTWGNYTDVLWSGCTLYYSWANGQNLLSVGAGMFCFASLASLALERGK